MRLIDADRLLEKLSENLEDFEMMISHKGRGIAVGTSMAIDRVNEQPTIDPESLRPHGRWKQARYTEAPLYLCSECDNPEYKQHKYCPHCGAKMEDIGE